ncbi:Uncharacterized protein Rs2_08187 [Raphanus sativus]|nr:Uncharacterized protein Rs2_08187 [Raphanus sativus]
MDLYNPQMGHDNFLVGDWDMKKQDAHMMCFAAVLSDCSPELLTPGIRFDLLHLEEAYEIGWILLLPSSDCSKSLSTIYAFSSTFQITLQLRRNRRVLVCLGSVSTFVKNNTNHGRLCLVVISPSSLVFNGLSSALITDLSTGGRRRYEK